MKVWALAPLLLGLAACAVPSRPTESQDATPEARAAVDRLRTERDYRPAPQGGENVSTFIDLPPHAYIAQGWAWDYWCMPRWYDCYRPVTWRRRSCAY
jgi:hypothetical protein